MSQVRVRFAPSPTGPLHIGGVRTALYNFLFARKHKGVFILRIEDTDQARYVEGAEEYIIESLKWCGITIDEGINEGGKYGPYRQSDRKRIYRQYADRLIDKGDAYFAFDTSGELDALRNEYEKRGETFIYNAAVRRSLKNSLTMSDSECREMIGKGEPYVIRYCMSPDEVIHFHDLVRGDIQVNTSSLDDKVLFKSDGMPTYHLANIVDDHLMEISHVIRGEEWLPSLPLHVMLYRSFGWNAPLFAHLPLLLKPDGKGKLSKRDGDKLGFPVFPLHWPYGDKARGFREDGYFPEAFVNMLALLGWNPGTEQELFSMEELIDAFSIEKVHKSGSRFDPEKARWFNHQYLQRRSNNQLALDFREYIRSEGYHIDIKDLEELVGMVKDRVSFVKEIWEQTDFFFRAPVTYDQESVKKRWKEYTPAQMTQLCELLASLSDFSPVTTEPAVRNWIESNGYSTGDIMNAFRLLIVGSMRGPKIFDIIKWIGKEETLRRINSGISTIGK